MIKTLPPDQTNLLNTEVSDATGLKISPLVLRYQLPSDGLPNMQQRMNAAAEIYLGGFESVREPFEVKPQDDGQLVTMKGTGRTAIILFGLVWTYLELSKTMTDLEKDDFSRLVQDQGFGAIWLSGSSLRESKQESAGGDGGGGTIVPWASHMPPSSNRRFKFHHIILQSCDLILCQNIESYQIY